MNDYSILDLFHQETQTQVTTLKESLAVLKTQPLSMVDLERATTALHSIWGSAKLVAREAAATLAQAMKDCFIAAQNKTVTLVEEQIDVLVHASKLLLNMSKPVEQEFEHWMSEHSWEVATTQKTISIILTETATTVTSPPQLITETVTETVNPPQQKQELAPTTTSIPKNTTSIKIGDDSMMDLFRLEAEAQVAVLNDGLLALESNTQSAQALETLMRAAHSIKGAARIVSLDAVVNLAHVMEDCFVAAQNKTITLNSNQVDALLQGVDLLQGITQVSNSDLPDWLVGNQAVFASTQVGIAAILNPQAVPLPVEQAAKNHEEILPIMASVNKKPETIKPETITESINTPVIENKNNSTITITENIPSPSIAVQERPDKTAAAPEQTAPQDRVVRVSAENLNRIMGLAGESLIEANWLQPHADSMTALKWRLVELSRTLEQLQEVLDRDNYEQDSRQLLENARNKEQECLNLLSTRLNELEVYAQRTANLSDRLYREVITSNMRPFADGVQGFPRMIRDLARKLNKQVKLDIVGKATSVDRDILKKLEAPLTHILRNATDHGIEMPQERIEKGKPPEGTIRLEAFHRGGMLAITIADDGKGISFEQLRKNH